MNKKQLLLLPCSLAGLIGFAGSALAASDSLEEIIVTAQKRSESLQDVSVAVSAFSDVTRDRIGITTIQDFTNFTPGITYSVSLDRMFVRGVGRYTNNLATSPAVATYGDGFYNSSNHQADGTPLFNERVEVLRGPQGTLYGRNSIGGALNVISKRPTDTFEAETRVVVGSKERRVIEALARGPITENIGFLIGANKTRQEEGYVENISGTDGEGRANNDFVMAQLSFKFGEAADLWLKYAYTKWDEGYGSAVNIFPYVTNTATTSLIASGSLGPSALFNTGPGLRPAAPQFTTPNPGVLNHRQTDNDFSSTETLDPDHQFVVEFVGHLGFADLKYVGGYHEYVYTLKQDFDNSSRKSYVYTPPSGLNPITIPTTVISTYVEDKNYYSNELNLISNSDGPLQWVVGAYQFHEHYNQPVTTYNPSFTQLATPRYSTAPFAFAPANPDQRFSYTNADITTKSLAGFAQVDYSFTEQWKATVGARYTKDKKFGDEFARYVFFDPTLTGSATSALDISPTTFGPTGGTPLPDGRYTRHLADEWDAVTGTAGLEFKPSDAALGYAKFTRGYKDGGLNPGSIQQFPFTDQESINAYEIGWKQEIGQRLVANLAVFYYDYKAAQIPLTIVRGPGLPNLTQTFNLDAESQGVELETTWRATDSLQLLFNYSYLDATIQDGGCYSDSLDNVALGIIGPNLCASGGHSVKDNRVPGSPKNKVAFNALYTLDFAPGSLIGSLSWTWRDTQYSSIFTRAEWLAPSYDQTDARLTWLDSKDRYTVIGYVRNIFDDEGFDGIAATSTAAGITRSFSLTPQRTYGLELQYRFGK